MLEGMTPRLLARSEQQEIEDETNDEFTPNLQTNFEIVPHMGKLTLDERIAQNAAAVVYTTKENPDVLIKYEVSYPHGSIHPLLRDYWLGLEASALNLSARPMFISPAAAMIKSRGPKVAFSAPRPKFNLDDHSGDEGEPHVGLVRYMVIERLPGCLSILHKMTPTSSGGDTTVSFAMAMGTDYLVPLIAELHGTAGIIHGDIHTGNICVGRDSKMKLIDFGLGKYVEEEADTMWVLPDHPALTPWQLEGATFARRDDVYKAVYIIASLMFGSALGTVGHELMEFDRATYLEWKKTGPSFDGSARDPIEIIPYMTPEAKVQAKAAFADVYTQLRTLVSVHTPIDYVKISKTLGRVYVLTKDPAEPQPPSPVMLDQ